MRLKDIVDALVPTGMKRLHDAIESARIPDPEPPVRESSVEGAETATSPGNANRWEWRSISKEPGEEEVSPDAHRAILRRAYATWCKNPLAGQIVNVTTWFVMGKGLGFTAPDPVVRDALNRFWNDPENDLQMAQRWMSNELQVYGEIFIRFFVNPIDGKVRMALIDPLEIRDIATDPDNVRKPVAYLREYTKAIPSSMWMNEFKSSSDTITLSGSAVREVIDASEILHVKVNNVSNHKRGISELYRVLRWLDAYDRWLEDRISINKARGAFAFLRKVPSAPNRASGPFNSDSSGKYVVPKPGSILVVHEGEDWQVLSPKIGADDAKEDGRSIKLMIAAGCGIFEHYFGDPSTGNLATARSMELPMVRKFEDRQRLFENVFGKIFQRVIDSGIVAGTIPFDADRTVEINFPPINPEDISLLTDTLVKQVDSGLISKDSARRLIPWINDPKSEAAEIEKEK
jgi:hypothetical protein